MRLEAMARKATSRKASPKKKPKAPPRRWRPFAWLRRAVLSLALAILALQGANFLLLDEPTNHLDIPAQETLQTVLEQFDGTILLVSHDRYLVSRLATQIWSLQPGHLTVFRGDYASFTTEHHTAQVKVQANI